MFSMRHAPFILAVPLLLAGTMSANAVPAFAEQTSQPCSACHVGGFGPQLTPFGRDFKLSGYTMRAGDTFTAPVSAMAVASYVHTQKGQPPPSSHYNGNDNLTFDQISLFVAGGIGDHFGGFAQFTWDGVGRSFSWDNLDLRAVDRETILGSDVLLGLSFNNSPTVQDEWNTLPAWGFPYTDSDLRPAPAAGTVISGTLAQSVLGITGYAWIDSQIYTEAGVYWTPSHGFLRAMGIDPDEGGGDLSGAAPYFRAAYVKDFGDSNVEVGAFALLPDLHPPGIMGTAADDYDDIGADVSYQYIGNHDNIFQASARYTYESQHLKATFGAGNATHLDNSLQELHFDASYYWKQTLGFTVSPFEVWGSTDTLLYADNRTFKPNSEGVMLQADYTPWPNGDAPLGPRFNMRVGIQYTVYSEFNGAGTNYDGLGHNAEDNNTLRIFTWIAY